MAYDLINNNNQLLTNLGTGASIFKPAAQPYVAPKASVPATPAIAPIDNSAAQWASLNAQIKALQNQIAQTPKLPAFDIMANYNTAKNKAAAAVNPQYDRALQQFLARNQQLTAEKNASVTQDRADVTTGLNQSLEDNTTNRTRTAEDVAAALEQIGLGEKRFQSQEGTQNDVQRRTDARALAASGLAGSGIGNGQTAETQRLRNEASGQQEEDFNNQKQAKQLFQTRTFEDLGKSDTRANQLADSKNKGIQLDLDSYLSKLAYDEQSFRSDQDIKRASDIIGQTEDYRQQGVAQFLASIAGAVRPQDYALAAATYK